MSGQPYAPREESPSSPGGISRWEALGTGVVMRVADPAALIPARRAVERELADIDRACSRFRDDSELVWLNARAGRRTRVGPVLFEALEVALRAARLTDGDVDPTVGRALELAGYDRDWRLLEPAPAPASRTAPGAVIDREAAADGPAAAEPARPRVSVRFRSGWETLDLDERSNTIRVPRGIALDLGASAKAWAADRGAAAAARAAGCGVLLSLGGDIATSGEAPPQGWRIHVTDDHRDDCSAPGQTITIEAGGLATSSTAVRRWRHGGLTMHHIIDPSSGAPVAAPWRTVSVAALDCTDANIAATAAIIRCERAPGWLAGLGLPARMLAWDGRVESVAGWPA